MYIPQVKAVHYKGVSVGLRKESTDITQASKETKVKMSRMTTEAMELFFKKHYLKNYPLLLSLLILLTIKLIKIIRFLKTQSGFTNPFGSGGLHSAKFLAQP